MDEHRISDVSLCGEGRQEVKQGWQSGYAGPDEFREVGPNVQMMFAFWPGKIKGLKNT